jgi:hypothetical protein
MIEMEQLQIEPFLDQKHTETKNSNICERCIRKKFKCLIVFMLTIITVTQLFMTVFEKIDEKHVNSFIDLFGSQNSTFWTSLMSKLRVPNNEEENTKGK